MLERVNGRLLERLLEVVEVQLSERVNGRLLERLLEVIEVVLLERVNGRLLERLLEIVEAVLLERVNGRLLERLLEVVEVQLLEVDEDLIDELEDKASDEVVGYLFNPICDEGMVEEVFASVALFGTEGFEIGGRLLVD